MLLCTPRRGPVLGPLVWVWALGSRCFPGKLLSCSAWGRLLRTWGETEVRWKIDGSCPGLRIGLFSGVRPPPWTPRRSPEQPEAPSPWVIRFGCWGSNFLTHLRVLPPLAQRVLQAPRGGGGVGGADGEDLSPCRLEAIFLGDFQAAQLRCRRDGGAGAAEGAWGAEPPLEAQAGGECTQAKCPHSRTSCPPGSPSVYLFTFPGSSNTSVFFLSCRSSGAALERS